MKRMPCIIIVGGTWGFPYGMASSRRVALLARALISTGYRVEVIHTTISERPGNVINKEPEGYFKGIHFQYATGTTIASPSFLIRRVVQFKGKLKTISLIRQISKGYDLKGIIIYSRQINAVAIISLVGKLLNVSVVLELNEWPVARKRISSFRHLMANAFCSLSPFMVDGCIVISRFIEKKIRAIRPSLSRNLFYIPILVDVEDGIPPVSLLSISENDRIEEGKYILFSGSLDYIDTIEFILNSFSNVLRKHNKCRLIITGKASISHNTETIIKLIRMKDLIDRVQLTGYIPRKELIILQKGAECLLAPLENDDQSNARMPTKIAEYLLTGKPVITSSIGEISNYLTDRENAYVCPPENVTSFSEAILNVLENSEEALEIGKRGREVTMNFFDFRSYADLLCQLFET